eukprot:TRINITY_DN10556_c0_g1_i3.p1 TRINITY_DN10556_c0_g1~~TRINITY_DN10556_c0_g1_i3.p1  ORF type:complete len:194 (-),score=11.17 TRINITY_DN10556_c0_g1_i3:3-584(-)
MFTMTSDVSVLLHKLYDHYNHLQELTQKWTFATKRGSTVLENTTNELIAATSIDADRLNQSYRALCTSLDTMRQIVHEMQILEYTARSEAEEYSQKVGAKHLVDRSPFGCRCSIIDYLVFLRTLITHYEDELDNKEIIITSGLQNTITSTKEFIPLQLAWNSSPFLDDSIASFLDYKTDLNYWINNLKIKNNI